MGLLDGLTVQQRELAMFRKEQSTVPKGSTLYTYGDSADVIYGIVSGKIQTFAKSIDGGEIPLKEAGPGELFGLAGLLPNAKIRMARAVATENSTLLEFKGDVVDLLQKHHGAPVANIFLKNFLNVLATQLIDLAIFNQSELKAKVQIHPDYPIQIDSWMENVQNALPSGFLQKMFSKTKYDAGSEIVKIGQVPDAFYVLKAGTVRLTYASGSMEQIYAPAVFATPNYFAKTPMTATIVTVTEAEIAPFTGKDLDNFLSKNPDQGLQLLDSLARLMFAQYLTVEYRR